MEQQELIHSRGGGSTLETGITTLENNLALSSRVEDVHVYDLTVSLLGTS